MSADWKDCERCKRRFFDVFNAHTCCDDCRVAVHHLDHSFYSQSVIRCPSCKGTYEVCDDEPDTDAMLEQCHHCEHEFEVNRHFLIEYESPAVTQTEEEAS